MRTVYKYEIWFDGECIMDRTSYDDCEYETEEEAVEEATEDIKNRIEQWKDDGSYYNETIEDFDIEIVEQEIEE